METVTHHGRETAYRLAGGEGAHAVCVHGSGGTHRVWAAQYAPDGPVRPAAAVDLSGHGDSEDVDADPGPDALDAYAADVVAVARETGARTLVGTSLGGAVVLRVALDAAFDPAALVLAGTGAKLAVTERLREWLADDFERAIEFLQGDDRLFHDADERTVEQSQVQLRATGQRVTRRDFLTSHRFDVRDRLDEVATPTLAVVGEHDGLTPPSYHEYLAANVREGEWREIPGAAHAVMIERPDAFNGAVGRFLEESA